MEVKIGVQNANRELVIDSSESRDDVEKAVSGALSGDERAALAHRQPRAAGARPGRQAGVRRDRLLDAGRSASAPDGRAAACRPRSGGEAERVHALGVVLGQPGEQPADRGQVHPGPVDPAGQQRGQRVALGGHPLRLRQRLAHQPAAPQRQPAAEPGVRRDRRPHPVDDERGLAGVGEALDDQIVRVSASRNAAISR